MMPKAKGDGRDLARTVTAQRTAPDHRHGGALEETAETLEPAANAATHPGAPGATYVPLGGGGIDSYELGAEIARGGMGQIRGAFDRRLGRTVAIKMLLPGASAELAERFEREARITARLMHPAIVPVYEAGRFPDGQPYYAMKWVAGRSLDHAIRAARTLRERLALLPAVITVVDAIAYAHSLRIIHRDLKPHNVLVGDFGETVVIDWGLAKNLAEENDAPSAPRFRSSPAQTQVGHIMGTGAYMPPEQASGERVDERADVYALGALLYHVLAGTPPYRGRDSDEVIDAVLRAPPPPLDEQVADLPPELATLVGRAMARDPEARPTARQLAEQLRQFETGKLVAAHDYSLWELARRWLGRHRTAVVVGAIAGLVLVAIAVVAVTRVVRERDRARDAQRAAEVARQLADRERLRAESSLTTVYEEQGRRDLLAGDPMRAATALATAYARGEPSPALRMMLGAALRPIEAQVARLDAGAVLLTAHLGAGRAVTVGNDGRMITWDGTGAARATIAGGWAGGKSATLSADGRVLATAHGDAVRLWDTATGAMVAELAGVAGPLALSADARWIATGAPLAIHEVATRRVRWRRDLAQAPELGPPLEGATALAFSSDGARLLVVEKSGTSAMLDAASGAMLQRYPHGKDPLLDGAISPSGGLVATTSSDGTARVWEATSGEALATFGGHLDVVDHVAFTPDGSLVATTSWDKTVRLWDPFSGAALATLVGHASLISDVSFSADGARLITAGYDHTARVWELARVLPRTVRAGETITSAALSPDGALVATATSETDPTRAVELFDTTTGASLRVWPLADGARQVRFSADGRMVAAGGLGGAAGVWLARTGEQVALLEAGGPVSAIAFSPDGARLATATPDAVAVWSLPDGARLGTLDAPGLAMALAWSPDGATLYEVSGTSLRTWDAAAAPPGAAPVYTLRATSRLPAEVAGFAALSPDGAELVLPLSDKTARVLALADGTTRELAGADESFPLAATWSRAGDLVATCSFDGVARIWDRAGQRLLLAIPAHGAGCTSVEIGVDRVVTSAFDGARIWPLPREVRSTDEVAAIVSP